MMETKSICPHDPFIPEVFYFTLPPIIQNLSG
jgi:hypothetical protein